MHSSTSTFNDQVEAFPHSDVAIKTTDVLLVRCRSSQTRWLLQGWMIPKYFTMEQ